MAPRPPLRKQDLVEAEVVRLADADGARARTASAEIRVPGGVPGDRGLVRVTHVGQHAAWGRLETLHEPSPDRVEAPCPVALTCGGCPWQTTAPAAQRRAREQMLSDLLGDLAPDATWRRWPGADRQTGYRTRALLMAGFGKGGLRLGFFAPGSHDLVPAEACVVQDPRVGRVLARTRDVLTRHRLAVYQDKTGQGVLRAVLYRVDPAVGQGLLTLVVARAQDLDRLAAELLAVPDVAGVFVNVNPAPGGAVLGPDTRHVAGATRQTLRYGELELGVGPTAFVQTRHDMACTLVDVVGDLLPARMNHLVDLYAGVGLFGLALRQRAARVTLVEREPAAVADARWNVARLAAPHVVPIERDAAVFAAELSALAPDAVILDPPRSGCAPAVLEAVAALPAGTRLVYVACGPPALARDLRVLAAAGWQVTDLVPCDMFPHTPHVEVVAGLRKSS